MGWQVMKVDSLATRGIAWRKIAAVGLVLLVLGVSGWLALARPDFERLAVYGYPGLFLIMLLSSASILLPLPGFATVMAAGTVANPVLIAVSAGLGSALGELTGYVAGCSGRSVIVEGRSARVIGRFEGWLSRYGFGALVLLALVPNPFFDAVGIAAGSLCFPARRFLAACIIGNVAKYFMLAVLGKTVSEMFG